MEERQANPSKQTFSLKIISQHNPAPLILNPKTHHNFDGNNCKRLSNKLFSVKSETLPQFSTATSLKDAISIQASSKLSIKHGNTHEYNPKNETVKQEQEEDTGRRSFIEELTQLSKEGQPFQMLGTGQKTFQLFECVEASSFRESDSQDQQSRISEVIDMTPEQIIFFNNFVSPSQESNQNGSRNDDSQAPFYLQNSRKASSSSNSEPANKRKVIKNFFKPKDSLVKDDKTCCNSQILAENKLKQGMSRLKLMNIEDTPTKVPMIE